MQFIKAPQIEGLFYLHIGAKPRPIHRVMSMEAADFWWAGALGYSLFRAFYSIVNEHFKLPGQVLVFWRGVIPSLLLLPTVFIFEWPADPMFYIAVIGCALLVTYSDGMHFNTSAKFGAGVTLRIMPLAVWVSFLLWLILYPEKAGLFIHKPWVGAGILLSLLGTVWAVMHLRKCEVSKAAFLYLLPVLFVMAAVDVLNKVAQDHSPLHAGAVLYVWLQSTSIAVFAFLYRKLFTNKEIQISQKLTDPRVLKAGLVIGMVLVGANLFKNYGMALADNPGYVAAIALSSPVFVTLYYKWRGIEEKANAAATWVFVISAVALVLLTRS